MRDGGFQVPISPSARPARKLEHQPTSFHCEGGPRPRTAKMQASVRKEWRVGPRSGRAIHRWSWRPPPLGRRAPDPARATPRPTLARPGTLPTRSAELRRPGLPELDVPPLGTCFFLYVCFLPPVRFPLSTLQSCFPKPPDREWDTLFPLLSRAAVETANAAPTPTTYRPRSEPSAP